MHTGLEDKIACSWAGEHAPYFEWLMSLVGGISWFEGQEKVLARLLERRFYWVHPIDENVALHGLALRYEYVSGRWERETNVLNGECSMLEVMVALALRVEKRLMSPPPPGAGRRAHLYFETLISRSGLDCPLEAVDSMVDLFLEDGFADCGNMRNGKRRTIWEQVNMIFMDEAELDSESEEDEYL